MKRSFHRSGGRHLRLVKKSGRLTSRAEEWVRQALDGGFAHLAIVFGARGSPLLTGPEAKERLDKTLVEQ